MGLLPLGHATLVAGPGFLAELRPDSQPDSHPDFPRDTRRDTLPDKPADPYALFQTATPHHRNVWV